MARYAVVKLFRYTVEVEARSKKEAIEKAGEEEISGADVVENCVSTTVARLGVKPKAKRPAS